MTLTEISTKVPLDDSQFNRHLLRYYFCKRLPVTEFLNFHFQCNEIVMCIILCISALSGIQT